MMLRMGLVVALAGLLSWTWAGCGGGKKCAPNANLICALDEANPNGAIFWVDSCGELQGISKTCGCGCTADAAGCEPCVCTPVCEDRLCGPDSCGGSCPPGCAPFESCSQDGACVACVPDCQGRECGSDGCGGDCPPGCVQGEGCDLDGQCVPCSPACDGKQCGPDGCGGSCPPGCPQGGDLLRGRTVRNLPPGVRGA